MTEYMLSVHHTADEVVPDEAKMNEMFAAVDAVAHHEPAQRHTGSWWVAR